VGEPAAGGVTINLQGFIGDLLELAHASLDIDGGDFQDIAIKHGLFTERPLTAEEVADDDGPWHEYGCEEGEPWLFHTEELKTFLKES
jgi:hypothetical protein